MSRDDSLESRSVDQYANGDTLESRQIRLVKALLFALLGVLLLIVGLNASLDGWLELGRPDSLLLLGMAAVVALSLARLRARRLAQAVWLVVFGTLTVLAQETFENGLAGGTPLLFAYSVPVAFAGLLIGRWALIFTAFASIAIVTLTYRLEEAGVSWVATDTDGGQTEVLVIVFALVIALLALVLDRFGVELKKAHAESLVRQGELARLVSELKREREAAELAGGKLSALANELEQRVDRRTRELSDALQELEAFAYSVSHDLRAPLRGIDGFSQALLEDYAHVLDETAKQYIDRIRAGARRMGELIDDLLNLSRLSYGDLMLGNVDLSLLANKVVDDLRSHEPERNVTVEIAPGMRVRGDARLLRIALENLLSNAWKFTALTERPLIEVGRTEQEGEAVHFVRDNGIGFDMSYAEKLFVPFQRLHSLRQFQGTGVGLATAQRIFRRHGGKIWAQSKVGEGTTFYFTIGT